MTAEELVKSIYPEAICEPDTFGVQYEVLTSPSNWCIGKTSSFYLCEHLSKLLSISVKSEEEAWRYAWIRVQQLMVEKLEQ